MTTLRIYKAQGLGNKMVLPLTIVAEQEIPDTDTTLEEARQVYTDQAKKMADVLYRHLPGGTMDALLVEMLTRKASLFRVPHMLADNTDRDTWGAS